MKDYSELSDCNNSADGGSTGQPVAHITGYHDGRCVIEPADRATVLPVGMALYRQQDASAAQAVPELTSRVVNEACWKFIDAMPHPLTPQVWNNLKPAVYAAVVHVLSAPPSEQAQTVPDGWKLVPVSLTPEMRQAWDSSPCGDDDDTNMQAAYCAMLAAAPVADVPKGEPSDEELDALWLEFQKKPTRYKNNFPMDIPDFARLVLARYTAPADTSSPKPAEEGDFNTGDSDLDTLLAMTFDMGQGIQGNHDIGVLYADSLEAVQAKLKGTAAIRNAALDEAAARARSLAAGGRTLREQEAAQEIVAAIEALKTDQQEKEE